MNILGQIMMIRRSIEGGINVMIYVKVKRNEENDNMFKFGCKGYGWVEDKDINKKFVDIQCEDNYDGARAYTVNKKSIEVCKFQKENTYK